MGKPERGTRGRWRGAGVAVDRSFLSHLLFFILLPYFLCTFISFFTVIIQTVDGTIRTDGALY